jgi:hypothetical protein
MLALGAPLAVGTVAGSAWLLAPPPHARGYLLYPRQALCAPGGPPAAADAARAQNRTAHAFRPARTSGAVLPPGLGQSLNPELLAPRG